MNTKVIFAIDDNQDFDKVGIFVRHMRQLNALGAIESTPTQCIGYWNGVLENSYMMNKTDYDRYVDAFGYTLKQACILIVPPMTRQPCHLAYSDGSTDTLKPMREVPVKEAYNNNAWTYVVETGKYFVC